MEKKITKKSLVQLMILFVLAIVINILSNFPSQVETYYSEAVYPAMSIVLRGVTGWIPFSLGDILYTIVAFWIAVRLFKTIRGIVKKNVSVRSFLLSVYRTLFLILCIYIVFNLFWGLNYNRLGIAYQLKLAQKEYDSAELKNLTTELAEKVNSYRKKLGDSLVSYPSPKEIFQQSELAYEHACEKFSFLNYGNFSIKSSLYGWLGNYMGFLGYYNPFTGESQVNTTVPPFVIPYTTCHEIGHQLGYATEDEANFVGYLSAVSSDKDYFKYSVYFDLFAYANGRLYLIDSSLAREQYKTLDTLVKRDYVTYKKFRADHRNPIEPYITLLYGKYLQANNQPKGMDTYDDVIGWLIAYRKKYGEL